MGQLHPRAHSRLFSCRTGGADSGDSRCRMVRHHLPASGRVAVRRHRDAVRLGMATVRCSVPGMGDCRSRIARPTTAATAHRWRNRRGPFCAGAIGSRLSNDLAVGGKVAGGTRRLTIEYALYRPTSRVRSIRSRQRIWPSQDLEAGPHAAPEAA